jgi:hypothetical protein
VTRSSSFQVRLRRASARSAGARSPLIRRLRVWLSRARSAALGGDLDPDQLWRVDPPDCFAPLTINGDGPRRDVQLRHREGRVEAYAWLLKSGNEAQLFEHVDGALLTDAWPDVGPHLPEQVRKAWAPLVFHAAEGWAEDYLIASLRAARPPKVSSRTRARAIKRLAERGLTADEIRAVLRCR